MTKIYNEVVIDMNPESDSYGETLHEDSFEYDGPMALAVSLRGRYSHGANDLGEYKSHVEMNYNGNRYFIVRTSGHDWKWDDDKWAVVSADDPKNVLNYTAQGSRDIVDPGDDGVSWAQGVVDSDSTYGTEAQAKIQQEGIETAPSLKYSEFSQYLDTATGNVKDVDGMVDYLQTHGMENMSRQKIIDALPNMPGLNVSASDMASAKSKQQSDIYGLQSGMMQERGKAITQAGVSGIYSPTSTGFGGGDMSDSYSKLAGVSQYEGGDVYGLAGGKEEELLNWIKDFTT